MDFVPLHFNGFPIIEVITFLPFLSPKLLRSLLVNYKMRGKARGEIVSNGSGTFFWTGENSTEIERQHGEMLQEEGEGIRTVRLS